MEIILAGALAAESSDIHIEPEEAYVRMRYRLDGVLNDILNTGFFWDTEMLVLASRQGFSLTEIPVIWSEFIEPDRKSRLNIIKTAFDYIRQSILLKIRLAKLKK